MNTSIKILIAEHDPTDLELILRQLKTANFNYLVETVKNEPEYTNALQTFIPDIILSDYSFPSFDGLTAFKIKEQTTPDTPFIIISGTIGEERAVDLIRSGITDYILKDRMLSLPVKIKRALKEAKEKKEKVITTMALQTALSDVQKIMDASLDIICAVDEAGFFVQVSAACETVLGYKPEELIGKPNMDFVYPGDHEKTRQTSRAVMAGKSETNFENRYIHKNGSLVPILWSARWDAKEKLRYAVGRDATEKKRLETALENERQRFYDLFAQAPSSIGVLKGPNHVYEMVNPLYLQLIGKKDIIGKTVREVLPEVVEQGFIDILDQVYKTGQPFFANERYVQLDKKGTGQLEDAYVNILYQVYKDDRGNNEGIFFFTVDVTEQVLSRKKVEESEKQYRQIVETAQEGIWLIDENNYTILVNKKMADILEYSPEEMTGKQNYVFMDDEWKLKAKENIADRKLGMHENHDFKYITKSGREVWANLSTNPVFDEQGIYRGALAMVTDITDRKKAKTELIKRDSQLTLAAEMAKLGYWEHDLLKDEFTFNDQFYAIFKTTAAAVGGYTMSSARYSEMFIHPDDRDIVRQSVAEAVASNDTSFSFNAAHRIIYATGEEGYISVNFFIVKDEQGRTIKNFGVNQDITANKLIEIRLNELNLDLQKQAKELAISNAELEQFAYVTSHDLQEPLRMVTSFLTQLDKKYGTVIDDKGKQYIAFAVDGAKRMRQIILDLLEFSRVGKMEDKQEAVDLNEVVADILVLFRKTIKDQTAAVIIDSLPVIQSYKTPLRQVFQNLLSNALKYSKEGTPCQVTITAEKSGTHWQFAVTDNGIGIDNEYFDKIFIIFQRLHNKDEYSGTGMGLAVTKKIVESIGGKIWVQSEEGKGSTFYFTIPEMIAVPSYHQIAMTETTWQ